MSHHALQRALVVALHDPSFVEAMHADPAAALAGFELDPRERADLLAVDRRAFAVDPLRPRRVLRAIADELRGSLAVALAETRSIRTAERFFASSQFHDAVRAGRPLVLALADHVTALLADGHLTSPLLPGVLAIERARAEARRDRPRPPRPGLALPAGLRLVACDAASLAALQAAEQHLFELSLLPLAALCDDRPALELPPWRDAEPLYLAVRAAPGDASLDELPEPLFRSLDALARAAAAGPVRRGEVGAVLAAVGLRVPNTDSLVDDLISDAYLEEGT